MEDTLKKHRTSPRIIVLNEVQEIIRQVLTVADEHTDVSVKTALTMLSEKVEELRAGHPKTDKSEDDDTVTPPTTVKTKGTHFVGESGDGKMMYLRRDSEGVYHGDDETRDTLVHIYGPFHTEQGARYASTHNTHTQRPQVL